MDTSPESLNFCDSGLVDVVSSATLSVSPAGPLLWSVKLQWFTCVRVVTSSVANPAHKEKTPLER